jgi:hypothetical protein
MHASSSSSPFSWLCRFGFVITLVSLGCAVALVVLEVRTDRLLDDHRKRQDAEPLLHDTAAGTRVRRHHVA